MRQLNQQNSTPQISPLWRFLPICLLLLLSTNYYPQAASSATAPGILDNTFGAGGMVTTDFGGGWASAVAIQIDGMILAAGYSPRDNSQNDFALARYTYDGKPDASFGWEGKIITDFSGQDDQAYAIATQADGRILVAGVTIPRSDPVLPDADFALARYRPNGALDGTFGLGGKVTLDFTVNDSAAAVVVQPDKKIVVVGDTRQYEWGQIALARFKPDGSLDSTFGVRGKVVTQIAYGPDVNALVLQPDGKLLVAGATLYKYAADNGAFIARYRTDGALDPDFGQNGIVELVDPGQYDRFNSLALQIDGKIVAAGTTTRNNGESLLLARYNPDGSLDDSFGVGGSVVTDISGTEEYAYAVQHQSDGKLLVAGYISSSASSGMDFLLARYTPNGQLDQTFGVDGLALADFGGDDQGYAMALYSDGRAVIAGKTGATGNNFAIARFQTDTFRFPPRVWFPFIGR